MQNKPGSRFSSLSRRRQWLLIIIIVALAAALLAGLYMLAQHFERAALVAEEPKGNLEGRFETSLRVEYGGKTYEQKQRLTSLKRFARWRPGRLSGPDDHRQPGEDRLPHPH